MSTGRGRGSGLVVRVPPSPVRWASGIRPRPILLASAGPSAPGEGYAPAKPPKTTPTRRNAYLLAALVRLGWLAVPPRRRGLRLAYSRPLRRASPR